MPLLFLRSFSFFLEEKNVFSYPHCYRMRHDFSEGAAFLKRNSEPPSNGRNEDINTYNGSQNSSPRSEESVVGALLPRALGSGPGLCLHELTVSPASEQRPLPSWQMQPGGQAPAIRSMCTSDSRSVAVGRRGVNRPGVNGVMKLPLGIRRKLSSGALSWGVGSGEHFPS